MFSGVWQCDFEVVQRDDLQGALRVGQEQGLRQQAFLQSVGIDRQSPVTVLSDGGDEISRACQLPTATARVLD